MHFRKIGENEKPDYRRDGDVIHGEDNSVDNWSKK